MVSISRSVVRQFRAVARRAGLIKLGSRATGFLALRATATTLCLQATDGDVAVEYKLSGEFAPAEFILPLQFLADCEAKSQEMVTLRREGERLLAMWSDRGVPQHREYPTNADFPVMPVTPADWSANPSSLLVALREAKATTDHSSTRYALGCLQLSGTTGSVTATDTRQLLTQRGFQFPWRDELLMRPTEVFSSPELVSQQPIEIGRSEHHVTVRSGDWTVHHRLEEEGRFPNVARIIPAPATIKTRLQVDQADAKFLTATVNRLPADDLQDRPVTVELNGAVMVRARKDDQSPMTELRLSRSQRVGEQMRIGTNRLFLSRALALGFSEIGFVDNQSPCVCQDATRTYLWMLLEPGGTLAADPQAVTIDSASVSIGNTAGQSTRAQAFATKQPEVTVRPLSTLPSPVNRISRQLANQAGSGVVKPARALAAGTLMTSHDVIEQALQLRDQLRTVTQGLTDLVTQIRQQRKQNRLMKSTLQSLKQLQLLDV